MSSLHLVEERATSCAGSRTPSSVLHVEGRLRVPVAVDLEQQVAGLLARGERRIELDLARLFDVDAAGIGELVRTYATVNAGHGQLQISAAHGHVRRLLDVTGVMPFLSGCRDRRQAGQVGTGD